MHGVAGEVVAAEVVAAEVVAAEVRQAVKMVARQMAVIIAGKEASIVFMASFEKVGSIGLVLICLQCLFHHDEFSNSIR